MYKTLKMELKACGEKGIVNIGGRKVLPLGKKLDEFKHLCTPPRCY